MPRFVLFLRATELSESGAIPSREIIEAMTAYSSSLNSANILLGGEGLVATNQPNAGARIAFPDKTVTQGPFKPLSELISGWWIIKAKDLDEAVDWARKCPIEDEAGVIEVRRIGEMSDFGEEMTEDLKRREDAMRADIETRVGGN